MCLSRPRSPPAPPPYPASTPKPRRAVQQNGFSNNIAAGMSSSKATAHNGAQVPGANGQVSNKVDLNGAAAPPVQKKKGRGRPRKEASERKTYVPTGRPRGRPRKNPE